MARAGARGVRARGAVRAPAQIRGRRRARAGRARRAAGPGQRRVHAALRPLLLREDNHQRWVGPRPAAEAPAAAPCVFSPADLQLKPYRTEEFVHKLYYETSRFSAFGQQWVVKAFINKNQRDPTQSSQREITYQVRSRRGRTCRSKLIATYIGLGGCAADPEEQVHGGAGAAVGVAARPVWRGRSSRAHRASHLQRGRGRRAATAAAAAGRRRHQPAAVQQGHPLQVLRCPPAPPARDAADGPFACRLIMFLTAK